MLKITAEAEHSDNSLLLSFDDIKDNPDALYRLAKKPADCHIAYIVYMSEDDLIIKIMDNSSISFTTTDDTGFDDDLAEGITYRFIKTSPDFSITFKVSNLEPVVPPARKR
jgi:hypothetical protein